MERLSPPHANFATGNRGSSRHRDKTPVPDIAGMSLRHQRKRPTILRFLEIKKEKDCNFLHIEGNNHRT